MCDERRGPLRFAIAPLFPPTFGFFVDAACGHGVMAGSRFRLLVCFSFLRQGFMCAESLSLFFLPLRCPLARRFCPRVVAVVLSCQCSLVVLLSRLLPCEVRGVTDG